MAATSRAWGVCRNLAVRSRPAASRRSPFLATAPQRRWYADETNDGKLPKHVEHSHTKNTTEPVPPESAASGVEDALGDRMSDEELHQALYGGRIEPQEGDEGLTKEQEEILYQEGRIPSKAEAEEKAEAMGLEEGQERGASTEDAALSALEQAAIKEKDYAYPERGTWGGKEYKFPLPPRPYPSNFNHKKRYHPVVDLLVRMMMRDGKLSPAQKRLAVAMNVLRTSPAPIYSPKFPLLPGTPPPSHLPLNPILYLTVAVDSVAPLLKVKHLAGAAGGGRALDVPVPLSLRTRRRHAFQWILDVVAKKPSKGSGRNQYGRRLAEEIIAVVEGRSGVWDKRKTVHKMGTTARVNVGKTKGAKKRKG